MDDMENEILTVKRPSWKDEHLTLLCGIANAGGGRLLITTNARDYNAGMRKIRKTFETIPDLTAKDLGIACTAEPVMDNSQLCLEISVPTPDFPVSYYGKYYLFSNGKNQTISKDVLERRIGFLYESSWETQVQPFVREEDIDPDMLRLMADVAGLDDTAQHDSTTAFSEILRFYSLKDIHTDSLTNIGVLLLHKNPHEFIQGAVIRIGLFGSSGEPTEISDIVRGSLYKQYVQTLDLLYDKYLFEAISLAGEISTDSTKLPPRKALEEAVLNALVHKDYKSGLPIVIGVYPDKLFIENVGRPPADWTEENLIGRHNSRPNNPSLVAALHKGGLFQGWGNGISLMISSCEEIGIDPPSFELNGDETIVEFPLGKHANREAEVKSDEPDRTHSNSDRITGKHIGKIKFHEKHSESRSADKETFVKTPSPSAGRSAKFVDRSFAAANDLYLTSTDEYVLKAIETNGRATAVRIAEVLGVSESTVRRSFKRLRELELIDRIGSDKAGYWKLLL